MIHCGNPNVAFIESILKHNLTKLTLRHSCDIDYCIILNLLLLNYDFFLCKLQLNSHNIATSFFFSSYFVTSHDIIFIFSHFLGAERTQQDRKVKFQTFSDLDSISHEHITTPLTI